MMGWVASALVLATFYLKTMIPLRIVAITSNLVFLGYGFSAGLIPIVVLHALLLPLNLFRLREMQTLIQRVKRSSRGDQSLDMVVPYMNVRTLPAGTTLFEKGDYSDQVFLILNGRVRVVGLGVIVNSGQLVGEMGLFATGQKRTDTVLCETEVEIASVSEDKLWELFYQNPEFGAYLLRLIVHRSGGKSEAEGPPSIIKV